MFQQKCSQSHPLPKTRAPFVWFHNTLKVNSKWNTSHSMIQKKVYSIWIPARGWLMYQPHMIKVHPPPPSPLPINTSINLGWTGLEGEDSELWPQLWSPLKGLLLPKFYQKHPPSLTLAGPWSTPAQEVFSLLWHLGFRGSCVGGILLWSAAIRWSLQRSGCRAYSKPSATSQARQMSWEHVPHFAQVLEQDSCQAPMV